MDGLYKDGETVDCFCNKCGFFGRMEAPRFLHPGCNYSANPLDVYPRRIAKE